MFLSANNNAKKGVFPSGKRSFELMRPQWGVPPGNQCFGRSINFFSHPDIILFSDDKDRSGFRLGTRVVGVISMSFKYPPAVSKLHVNILPFEISFRNPRVSSSDAPSLYGSPLFLGAKGGGRI